MAITNKQLKRVASGDLVKIKNKPLLVLTTNVEDGHVALVSHDNKQIGRALELIDDLCAPNLELYGTQLALIHTLAQAFDPLYIYRDGRLAYVCKIGSLRVKWNVSKVTRKVFYAARTAGWQFHSTRRQDEEGARFHLTGPRLVATVILTGEADDAEYIVSFKPR